MVNDEIVNYIKIELSKGEGRQEITDSLVKVGWQINDVQEAFDSISSPVSSIPAQSQSIGEMITEKDYPITKLWIFKVPIIIIIVSIIALFFNRWYPILALLFPIYLISNPLVRASFHYSTEPKFFVVKQGVLSKNQRNLPYGVIQNVMVKQDWFDRVFGIASLSVENASQGGGIGGSSKNRSFRLSGFSRQPQSEGVGSSGNKVNIPGLKKEDAETLKLILLQRMKENPIEDSQSGL